MFAILNAMRRRYHDSHRANEQPANPSNTTPKENIMTGKLENKIALITGATSGIGLAAARRFALEGAQLIITGRRQAELDAAVEAIGHDAVGLSVDSSDLAALDRLYDTIRERFGRIDVL